MSYNTYQLRKDPNSRAIALDRLRLLFDMGRVHVIGRTAYRKGGVMAPFMECSRDTVDFLENRLTSKDNHVVLFFQILDNHDKIWNEGIHYILLGDSWALFSRHFVERID